MRNNTTLDPKTKRMFAQRFKSESKTYTEKLAAGQLRRDSHETFLLNKRPYAQISIDAMASDRKSKS